MASCNITYLKTGVDLSVLQLLKASTEEIFCFEHILQEEAFKLKWFQELPLRRDSSSKVAIVEFFLIDEDKVSWKAQVKFIAINGPKLIISHYGRDNLPIGSGITSEWNDNYGSKQLVEQSRPHFSDKKRVSRLKEYLATKMYVERAADIIAEITKRKKKDVETRGCSEILGDRIGTAKPWMTDRCKNCIR